MTGPDLEFRLLGPLEVVLGGTVVDLGRSRDRSVLALLVLHANQVVPVDRFVAELWGDRPTPSAAHALQVHISNLRKRLEPDRSKGAEAGLIRTQPPGYLLQVSSDQLDAARFEALAHHGRRALRDGDVDGARTTLREALALWRGPALADLAYEPWAEQEAARLESLRLTVMEDQFEADLAAGHHPDAIGAIEVFVQRNPLRGAGVGPADAGAVSQRSPGRGVAGGRSAAGHAARRARSRPQCRDPRPGAGDPHPGRQPRSRPGPGPRAGHRPERGQRRGGPARAPAPAHDEQKVVSALFADLTGSTTLAEALEPEEFKVVVDEAVARMIAAVARYGGTVTSVAGDGILALFGAPQAHEDDAERAVRAGLEIVADVAAYGDEVARAWNVEAPRAHVGVHSGSVVLGSLGGGEVELTAMGDTVNTASRLEGAAAPGTVLVGSSTRRQLEALFDFGEPRELTLKGKAEAVSASEVTGVHLTQAKVRGLAGVDVEMVGRQRELGVGRGALDGVLAGTGGIVVVTGEAGMGKSRLLTELGRYFLASGDHDRPRTWLAGRSLSYGEQLPYGPWREMLRTWLGVGDTDPDLRVRVRLRGRLDTLFGAAGQALQPFLGSLLGLRLDPDAAEQVRSLSPQALQDETLAAVVTLLGRLAADGPVVVALDDMHWADGDSIRLVDQLLEVTEFAALLIITAQRPERQHPSWAIHDEALRRYPHRSVEIPLGPLAGGGDAQLLDALVGASTLPPQLQLALLDAAEGNPFFLEELIRSLLDVGALIRDGDGWRLGREVSLEVPETVEKVIQSRIDGLSPFGRDVLAAASVLGRQFEFELLAAIVDEPRALDASLRDLQRLDMVREAQRWPQPEYRFKHSLIQETAYRSLVGSRRRLLHGRAARAIEARADASQVPVNGLLAHHFEQAGELEAALRFHRLAALDARALLAQQSAFAHYDAALSLIDALPPGEEVEPSVVAELALGRGQLHRQLGQDEPAARDLHRALSAARDAGAAKDELDAMFELGILELQRGTQDQAFRRFEAGLSVAEAAGNEVGQAALLGRLAIESVRRLQFVDALDQAQRAVTVARASGNEEALAWGLDGLKLVALSIGDLPSFRSIVLELEGLLRRQDDSLLLQHALAEHGVEAAARGQWNETFTLLDEALELNEAAGNRAERPLLLSLRANLERGNGRYGAARRTVAEASGLAQELDHHLWSAWAAVTSAALELDLVDPAAALSCLDPIQLLDDRDVADDQLLRGHAHAAHAHALLGQRTGAATALGITEDLRAQVSCPPGRLYLYGFDAEVAAARTHFLLGDAARARAILEPVLAAAEGAGWCEAIAATSLALGEIHAPDRPEVAAGHIERAIAVSRSAALPGLEWRGSSHAAALHRRAGRPVEAALADARADELVEALGESLDDQALAFAFRQRVRQQRTAWG